MERVKEYKNKALKFKTFLHAPFLPFSSPLPKNLIYVRIKMYIFGG